MSTFEALLIVPVAFLFSAYLIVGVGIVAAGPDRPLPLPGWLSRTADRVLSRPTEGTPASEAETAVTRAVAATSRIRPITVVIASVIVVVIQWATVGYALEPTTEPVARLLLGVEVAAVVLWIAYVMLAWARSHRA